MDYTVNMVAGKHILEVIASFDLVDLSVLNMRGWRLLSGKGNILRYIPGECIFLNVSHNLELSSSLEKKSVVQSLCTRPCWDDLAIELMAKLFYCFS